MVLDELARMMLPQMDTTMADEECAGKDEKNMMVMITPPYKNHKKPAEVNNLSLLPLPLLHHFRTTVSPLPPPMKLFPSETTAEETEAAAGKDTDNSDSYE